MECIGSVDQGTQSTRFFLYDKDCTVIASSQIPVAQIFPHQGWVDQDPMAIWKSVQEAVSETMGQAEEKYGQGKITVKAIGITNQRETTIVWDKNTGKPLCNAIVWLDNRTSAIAEAMAAKLGGRDAFRAITGLPTSTYFSAYKLKWMLENVPEVKQAADEGRCMFGTVDTWLLYNFTGGANGGRSGGDNGNSGGVHITDVSNASRTNLMDISNLQWHQNMIKTFGASNVILPEIKSNAEEYGKVCASALPQLAGVPISGCLGDQQAAMMGQRCQEKEAKNTYGTGCFMLLHTGTTPVESTHGLLTTVAYQLGPHAAPCYALEGSIAIAGQGITWLRDSLGLINDAAESEALAESVPNCGGVFFVPAFGGLLAPWWEPEARGIILGLTQHTNKAHIVRAMLEAISFQTRDVLEAMKKDSEMNLACLYVDGGASKNNTLMQMQADILQVPVRRPAHMETTSLGAALAAGIAVGFWTVEEAFAGKKDGGTLFEPKIVAEKADKRHGRWKKAVERSMQLAEITAAEEEGGM
jgi:glycerol kinase